MISFFKQIRQQLIGQNKLKKYVFYAIGEIILVVVGILIALKINNWNSDQIKHQEEVEVYKNIKEQISQNEEEILEIKDLNNYYTSQYIYANNIISQHRAQSLDTLALIVINLSRYSDFQGNENIYETLVNSGDTKLLKNRDIQNQLQRLEATYRHMNKLEDIHWEIIMKELSPELRGVINYSTLSVEKPEKLYSVEIQNFIIESIFLTKGKDSVYNKALIQTKTIKDLVDEELKQKN